MSTASAVSLRDSNAPPPQRRQEKCVLVTGASTGIGREITRQLAALGCVVFAGARKERDLRSLACVPNVRPLMLDVTRMNDIEAAVAVVRQSGLGLYGLVNNAGVGSVGSITGDSAAELEFVMSVNMFGCWHVTRAFAPFVICQRGRIVNIGSIAGVLPAENASAYSISKQALEAFTDSLAIELAVHGVNVSIVEPGAFNTNLISNVIARIGDDAGLPNLRDFKGPEEVAATVLTALFEDRPRRRYLVVSSESEAQRTLQWLFEKAAQMNNGHRRSFSRDELVGMLDCALSRFASIDRSS